MAVLAILLATIIPFFIFKEARSVNIDKNVGAEFANLKAPTKDDAPPPPPPPPPAAIEQKVKFTAPKVTTDSVEDTRMLNQDDLNQSSTNTAPVETTEEIVVDDTKNQVIEQAAPILTIVEMPPEFVGGEDAMYKWLSENIKFPQVAKETQISGTVIVTFVVERDGSISNIKVLKDIGGGCGDEAMRVVKIMPKWKIGKQNGIPVRVQYNLPIKFSLVE